MRILIYIKLLLLIAVGDVFSSWDITVRSHKIVGVLYDIKNEKYREDHSYYFPEYTLHDTVLYSGVKPLKKRRKTIKRLASDADITPYYAHIKLEKPILASGVNSYIYSRLFVEHTDSYTVYVLDEIGDKWYKKTNRITYEGYQVPNYIDLSGLGEIKAEAGKKIDGRNIKIKEIVIAARPVSDRFRFVVGEFKILAGDNVEIEYYHPFFDPIVNKTNQIIQVNSLYSLPGLPTIHNTFNYYGLYERGNSRFYITPDHGGETSDERGFELKKVVLGRVFDLYPFYEERGVDKSAIERRFHSLVSGALEENAFRDSVSQIVAEFNDPHFYVKSPSKNQNKVRLYNGPFLLYELRGRVMIAAVLDENVSADIEVGMEVLDIDGRSPMSIVDSLFHNQNTPKKLSRRQIVLGLLRRPAGGNLSLKVQKSPTEVVDMEVAYDQNRSIPRDLVPGHLEFKKLDNIAYFHIRKWTREVYIRFLNHINEIQSSDGLILDLRSNGGGETASVVRLLSLFIEGPTVVNHMYNPSNDSRETLVINANDRYHIDLPLVVLVNGSSASASEEFINVVKHYQLGTVIGNERTKGAYAPMYDIVFPDGFTIAMNCLFRPQTPSGAVFESEGLDPDVWVRLETIGDLVHRDDKILQVAQEFIGR